MLIISTGGLLNADTFESATASAAFEGTPHSIAASIFAKLRRRARSWLGRTGGWAATPTGRLAPELDPATNFGASIL